MKKVMIFSIIVISFQSCNHYRFQADSMHWLQFRGPNASGIAPENADPPVHFSADSNVLWKTPLMSGWSSPCIVNDRIFLTGFDDSDSLLYTFAINRKNGEILWKDSIRPHSYPDIHPVNTYANPTVTSDGKKIFAHFINYGLIAYDLNGVKNWEFQHEVFTDRLKGGISPVVLDSMIILNINSREPRIYALSCQTGDTIWMVSHPKHQGVSPRGSATPVRWNDLIILHRGNEILALNLSDGQPVWWMITPSNAEGTPVIQDDVLYVNTWILGGDKGPKESMPSFDDLVRDYDQNSNMIIEKDEFPDDWIIIERSGISDVESVVITMKFGWFWNKSKDKDQDGAYNEIEWIAMLEAFVGLGLHGMLALPLNGSGERPDTDVLWKINEDTPEVPSPLVVHEKILFIKDGGIISVIDGETGKIVYKDRIGTGGSYLSSPLLAGNRVYTCSYNGTVTILSADDFSILARNKLREKIAASPVAVDDVLYIRTDKHLYAFREQ